MRTTNISEAKASLSRLIAEVEGGAEIILSRAGKPVAKLIRFDANKEPRDFSAGEWRGRIRIADDFDELPAEFMSHFSPDEADSEE